MTDPRIAAIRERAEKLHENGVWNNAGAFTLAVGTDIPWLLSELDRLAAQVEGMRAENLTLRNVGIRLTEQVEWMRAATMEECAKALDERAKKYGAAADKHLGNPPLRREFEVCQNEAIGCAHVLRAFATRPAAEREEEK